VLSHLVGFTSVVYPPGKRLLNRAVWPPGTARRGAPAPRGVALRHRAAWRSGTVRDLENAAKCGEGSQFSDFSISQTENATNWAPRTDFAAFSRLLGGQQGTPRRGTAPAAAGGGGGAVRMALPQ
jgi:hypothetical protein